MRTLFRAVVVLIVVAIALIAIAIGLLLTFDLNRLKPVLQDAIEERGLALAIPGDLSWRFLPTLGLELGQMSLTNPQSGETLAAIESASVTVLLRPLLNKEIIVDGLQVTGMQANYRVDENNTSGWQPLLDSLDQAPTNEPVPSESAQSAPKLEINHIDIHNLSATYEDAISGSKALLRDASIQSTELSLDGSPFPLKLSASAIYGAYPQIDIRWQSLVSINPDKKRLEIIDGQGSIEADGSQTNLELSNTLSWGPLSSAGDAKISGDNLKGVLKAFQVDAFASAKEDALKRFELQLQYELKGYNLRIQKAKLHVDGTEVEGDFLLQNDRQINIESHWQATTLNLDRYFPPSSEPPSEEPPKPASEPTPLPFDLLQNLNANITFSMQELLARGIATRDLKLAVRASKGLVTLSDLSGNMVEGTFKGQGVLDARQPPAELDVSLDTQGIDLGKLLQALADQNHLAGSVTASVHLGSTGKTVEALLDNLQMQAQAQSEHLKLVPFNIEQQFCNAVALLQRSTPPQDVNWPEQTMLEPVKLEIQFSNNTLQLEGLNAEIANLVAAATGTFNVKTGRFDVPFKLSLGDFADTLPGCLPIDEKWRKRALPIRCKGSLSDIGVRTCLPDTELLTNMLKDKVEQKAKQKLEKEKDRAEEKLEHKAKELLNKELGEEKAKEAEDEIRSIFDRLKGN